jgi:hypothetical protein
MKFFTLLTPIVTTILSNKPITNATNSSLPLAVAQSTATATYAKNSSIFIAEETKYEKRLRKRREAGRKRRDVEFLLAPHQTNSETVKN